MKLKLGTRFIITAKDGLTFNQNHKEGQGVMTRYIVKRYIFTTEEDFNKSYRNKVCKIFVDKA